MSDDNRSPPRIVVVGVPNARRVRAFLDAAHHLGLTQVEVLPYPDAIAGRCDTPPPGSLVRIESPSECSATARAILKAGIAPLEAVGGLPLSECEIDRLACDRGEMLALRQWFLGFRDVLLRWQERWEPAAIAWMSHPAAIVTAFDKCACLDLWSRAELPVPRRFTGIASYAQLRSEVQEGHARVFVKPRYGYSAIGAVAVEWRGPLVRALTTVEAAWSDSGQRLFVSKRCQVLTGEIAVARLIDTLAVEEIVVEEWLPKARWNGTPFDLRIVTVAGRARHVVGRANASPFTNLNLDARRMPREAVEHRLGASWPELNSLAEQAAAQIPDACALGLDILVRPNRRSFALLEANAFGDYLPGLLHDGESTYEAQLRAAGQRMGALA